MVFCGDPTMVSAEASCEFVPKGSPQKYEKTRIYSSMWTAVLLASPCTQAPVYWCEIGSYGGQEVGDSKPDQHKPETKRLFGKRGQLVSS